MKDKQEEKGQKQGSPEACHDTPEAFENTLEFTDRFATVDAIQGTP